MTTRFLLLRSFAPLRAIPMICVAIGLAACIFRTPGKSPTVSLYPPIGFTETDLLGVWHKRVGGYGSDESLTLNPDHTFKQVYDDHEDGFHFETQGTWHLEQGQDRCTYLHLEGMRYFYQTRESALNGNRLGDNKELVHFWDPCGNQFIDMPDKVILLVASQSDFARDMVLQYLKPTVDMTDTLLEWVSQ